MEWHAEPARRDPGLRRRRDGPGRTRAVRAAGGEVRDDQRADAPPDDRVRERTHDRSPERPPEPTGPAACFLHAMIARGRLAFSTDEAVRALGGSLHQARWILRRLKTSGRIAVPYRGFHVVLAPEHRAAGAPPAELFLPELMAHLEIPYYAGLLTAAAHHGAAERPGEMQVVVPVNRPRLRCGPARVDFVARHNAADVPVVEAPTARRPLRVSTPEATAFDLVGYPRHCGGLGEVAAVLAELAPRLDAARLRAAAELSPVPWSQRLGFLLERCGHGDRAEPLAARVAAAAPEWAPLSPRRQSDRARWSDRWRLAVNRRV